jgi:hypothetical protein
LEADVTARTEELLPDENGNFTSPALQALEGVWDDYDLERTDEAEVGRVIGRVESFVKEKISEMERDAEAREVDALDPNRVAILGAFQDHLTALRVMRKAISEENYDSVEHSFEILQSATNRMVTGLAGIVEDRGQYTRIRCVRCSTENEKGAGYCCQCSAVLPKVEEENRTRVIATDGGAEEIGEETTPNYIEISEAHESWEAGRLQAELFYQVIQKVRERQVSQYEEMEKELAGEDSQNSTYAEHLRSYLATLEHAAEALDQMLFGLEQGELETVETGFSDYAEATIELVKLDRETEVQLEAEPSQAT